MFDRASPNADATDAEEEEDLGRPAWSRRADHAPALGLPSSTRELAVRVPGAFPGTPAAGSSFLSPSSALSPSSPSSSPSSSAKEKDNSASSSTALEAKADARARNKRRSPLDAALAMQLRPGLGVGADGAWLVRFLMSFFGWFAVLVAGGQEFN
ncbi:hypothetical protein B0H17DRAFT_1200177 [Mycena rosella]|uniref:Uncharacterized protein n=1 Tax=Mycena rosella TaxID=1033263 RepID=A0AAD7GK49_MYCRO|nr:hypothetical protein B0H17DRAFT_1200177 [Mycena rosella]